ncbi:MAG: class I SAM-dependent methyltransferase [Thermoanaerobaculia bacterium]
MLRHLWRTARKRINESRCRKLPAGGRLHVGCGPVHLDGWINIDIRRYPAVDYVLDVRDGLPFHALKFIFAEHFIEHLPFWEARKFLSDCRSALAPNGVLRLSTPNLDWVHRTQYEAPDVLHCFQLNQSFRGWSHQFLYNAQTLTAVLRNAGFDRVEFLSYGRSRHPELDGMERHERSPDSPELPHVLIVEASGINTSTTDELPGAFDFLESLGAS